MVSHKGLATNKELGGLQMLLLTSFRHHSDFTFQVPKLILQTELVIFLSDSGSIF